MNSSEWQQSYNHQQPYSSGTPHLPPSSHQESINTLPAISSFLPSCRNLQSPLTDPALNLLSSSCYEPISPAIFKEAAKYIGDDLLNSVCKESQSFLQCDSESRYEGSFPNSALDYSISSLGYDASTVDQKPIGYSSSAIDQKPIGYSSSTIDQKPIGYSSSTIEQKPINFDSSTIDQKSVPFKSSSSDNFNSSSSTNVNSSLSTNFNSSSTTNFNSSSSVLDEQSPSPFGVLPHLAVKPATVSRSSHENFAAPVSKTAQAYSNGPYAAENNVTTHNNPLSNSSLSNDTATPSPAAINSLSSSFSSPSNEYTFSPQQSMGAYNKTVHSPAPRSPSVAQNSYPSSPYTNIDSVGPIPAVPPCSPLMNGGTYVNTMKSVPNAIRNNGLHKQPLVPGSSSSAISNNVSACYTPQPHGGPILGLSKTPEYHHEYGIYAPDRVSPSSGYTSMPSSRSNDSRLSASPRTAANLLYESQMRYGHLRSVPAATLPSPTYQPNNGSGHDVQYSTQKMKPPSYAPCPTPSINNSNVPCYSGQSKMMSNKVAPDVDPYVYNSPEEDEKVGADIFDMQINMRRPTPYSKQLDNNYLYQNNKTNCAMTPRPNPTDSYYNRSRTYQIANNASLVQPPVNIKKEPISSDYQVPIMNGYFNSVDLGYNGDIFDIPRKRGGRRGRRKVGANIGSRGGGRGRGRGRGRTDEDRSVYFYNTSTRQEYNLKQQFKQDPDYVPVINISDQASKVSLGNFSLPSSATFNWGLGSSGSMGSAKPTPLDGMSHIKQELSHYDIMMQVRPRRNLRSLSKKGDNAFNCEFSVFLEKRESPSVGTVWPCKEEPEPEVPETPQMPELEPEESKKNIEKNCIKKEKVSDDSKSLKLKFLFDVDSNKWICERGMGTSDSPLTLSSEDEDDSSEDTSLSTTSEEFQLLASHEIKKEIKSECDSDLNNNETVSFIQNISSAETNSNCNSVGRQRHLSSVTNSETFSAGNQKVISEPQPAPNQGNGEVLQEDKNDKSPSPEEEDSNNKEAESAVPNNSKESLEKSEEMARKPTRRTGTLRSSKKEPEPGPSTQLDSAEENGDNLSFDDSDTDPVWTPVSSKSKDTDPFSGGPTGRKKVSTAKSGGGKKATPRNKKRKAPSPSPSSSDNPSTPAEAKPKKRREPKKKSGGEGRGRGGKKENKERFLIAKADINEPTPYIWKVDKKSSMLQRYEISEQNGVLLYHSSFTYAAGNQFCVNNYVEANVKVLSPDTVQYIGPNLEETAEVALSGIKQEEKPERKEDIFDYLKEDFIIYCQCLLSQDVDPKFLEEVKRFDDDYFLKPMRNLDSLAEVKKEKFWNEKWNEEIKKSIHTFPQVNILESSIENVKCQACERNAGMSIKLLQFFGQAYNPRNLANVASPAPAKTQFSVCDNCSISVSLYSRLHHYKYNLFVECHSKASQVKANNSDVQAPEAVLKVCLEDVPWVEKLFSEACQLWLDCKQEDEEDNS